MREQEIARRRTRSRTVRIVLLVVAAIVAVFVLVIVAGRFTDDEGTTNSLATTDHTSVVEHASDLR